MRLKDKIAIITGGSQGLGKAIAEEFSREGAFSVIVSRTIEKGLKVAEEIKEQGGKAIAIACDTSKLDQVIEMVQKVKDECGRIDILVNNAGIIRPAMLINMTEEQWDEVINVNLKGYFNCIRECAKVMISQRYGRIINISSVAGQRGTIGQANYAAAKAGILGLTKAAAKELAKYGITVNAVAPGLFKTPMTENIPNHIVEKAIQETPLGRLGEPWEVAKLVAFLASDDAAYITGQVIGINGGIYM